VCVCVGALARHGMGSDNVYDMPLVVFTIKGPRSIQRCRCMDPYASKMKEQNSESRVALGGERRFGLFA
jgi:hypothetical protein